MTTALLFVAAAITAYLVSGWNPAITLSKAIYKKDIRQCGSGNPGFTNFKRSFGNRWAWWVLLLDLSKGAAVILTFALLLKKEADMFQIGAAVTGLFAVLGHSFPVWYRFKGGKGFLVSLSAVLVTDWRVGLIATAIMVILLLTTKYMSLSTVTAMLISPILLAVFKCDIVSVVITAVYVIFVAVRHKENFKRLRAGTENKFKLRSH